MLTQRKPHGPYPIMRSSRLFLWAFHGDGPRFARVFRDAWLRVPMGARRTLLSHWRSKKPRYAPGAEPKSEPPWPHVEISDETSDSLRGPSGSAMAQAKWLGCSFWFLATAVDIMPEEVAQVLVAHELAHAYILTGDPEHVTKSQSKIGYIMEESEVADVLGGYWGFDPEMLERWKDENQDRI